MTGKRQGNCGGYGLYGTTADAVIVQAVVLAVISNARLLVAAVLFCGKGEGSIWSGLEFQVVV